MVIGFVQKGIANTLCRYLQQSKISAKVHDIQDNDKVKFLVVVNNQEDVYTARHIAEDFARNPQAAKFQKAAWETGETYQPISFPELSSILSLAVKTPFTSLIILLCIIVYLGFYAGFSNQIRSFLSIQALPSLLENHQWWRILGPNFIHFGLLHIAFNLLWWWILGSRLEQILGTFWLIMLFIVSSIFANISQLLATGPSFGGMSGVVYALFGFVWWIGWLRPAWHISLPNAYVGFMLVWLVLGFINILPVNIANHAHLFGLLSGCLLALLLHFSVKLSSAND